MSTLKLEVGKKYRDGNGRTFLIVYEVVETGMKKSWCRICNTDKPLD